MAEKKKRCQYLVVFDWMYGNFGFNVSEANALAVVYGFCQDGKSWYQGGSTYLAERLHISQKSAKNYLANFVKIGILKKGTRMVGKVAYNIYQTVPDIENLVLTDEEDPGKIFPSEKNSPVKNLPSDPGKIFPQTRVNFSHKKEIEKEIEKSIYQREAPKRDGWMESNPDRNEVEETFREVLNLDKQKQRCDPALLEELLTLIVEMYCCPNQVQYIGKVPYATVCVRKMLDKMDGTHIEYIMESLAKASLPIRNVRAYLQTVILRATATNEFYWMTKSEDTCAKQSSAQTLPAIDTAAAAMSRRLRKGGGST